MSFKDDQQVPAYIGQPSEEELQTAHAECIVALSKYAELLAATDPHPAYVLSQLSTLPAIAFTTQLLPRYAWQNSTQQSTGEKPSPTSPSASGEESSKTSSGTPDTGDSSTDGGSTSPST